MRPSTLPPFTLSFSLSLPPAGRVPKVKGLGLDTVGVETGPTGVIKVRSLNDMCKELGGEGACLECTGEQA
jgi:hypothetical protein